MEPPGAPISPGRRFGTSSYAARVRRRQRYSLSVRQQQQPVLRQRCLAPSPARHAGWNNRADFVYRHRGSTGGKITQALSRRTGSSTSPRKTASMRCPRPAASRAASPISFIRPVLSLGGRDIFIDAQSNLCAVQTNRGRRQEAGGRPRPLPTGLCPAGSSTTLAASDVSASNAIYALDLSTGDNRLVMTNTAGGGGRFLPAFARAGRPVPGQSIRGNLPFPVRTGGSYKKIS